MQRGEIDGKPDMMTFFVRDYKNLSKTRDIVSRDRLIDGTVMSAVVAGRSVAFRPKVLGLPQGL